MKIIAHHDKAFSGALNRVAARAKLQGSAVEKSVKAILSAMERGGDRALRPRMGACAPEDQAQFSQRLRSKSMSTPWSNER